MLSGVLSVAAVSVFAKQLGPGGYGWLTLATAVGALTGGVLLQPIQQSLARFYARPALGDDLTSTLAVLLLMTTGGLLIVALAVEWSGVLTLPTGVALAAYGIGCGQGLFDFSIQHANNAMRTSRYTAMYLAKSLMGLSLGWSAIALGLRERAVAAALVVAYVVPAIGANWPCWRAALNGRWSRTALGIVTPYAMPLGLTLLLSSALSWADRLILGVSLGQQSAGLFGATADITQQSLGVLSGALFLGWYPRIVAALDVGGRASADQLMSQYSTQVLAVVPVAGIGFVLIRQELALVMLGSKYAGDSTRLIPWLAAAAVLAGLRTFYLEVPLHLGGRMRALLANVAVSASASVGLNVWLVRRHGIIGAGEAAVIAQGIGCALAVVLGRGVVTLWPRGRDVIRITAACTVMVITVGLFRAEGVVGMVEQVIAGSVAYAISAALLDVCGVRSWTVRVVRCALGQG